jgi:hypothetical protein
MCLQKNRLSVQHNISEKIIYYLSEQFCVAEMCCRNSLWTKSGWNRFFGTKTGQAWWQTILLCKVVSNGGVRSTFCLRLTAKLSAEGLETTFWTTHPPPLQTLLKLITKSPLWHIWWPMTQDIWDKGAICYNGRVSDKPRRLPLHQGTQRTTAHFTVVSTVLCTGYEENKTVSCVLMNVILVLKRSILTTFDASKSHKPYM